MTTKARANNLKALIGKPIMLLHKHGDQGEGPFIFTGFEHPFFSVFDPAREKEFWYNAMTIDAFTEVKSDKQ